MPKKKRSISDLGKPLYLIFVWSLYRMTYLSTSAITRTPVSKYSFFTLTIPVSTHFIPFALSQTQHFDIILFLTSNYYLYDNCGMLYTSEKTIGPLSNHLLPYPSFSPPLMGVFIMISLGRNIKNMYHTHFFNDNIFFPIRTLSIASLYIFVKFFSIIRGCMVTDVNILVLPGVALCVPKRLRLNTPSGSQ